MGASRIKSDIFERFVGIARKEEVEEWKVLARSC